MAYGHARGRPGTGRRRRWWVPGGDQRPHLPPVGGLGFSGGPPRAWQEPNRSSARIEPATAAFRRRLREALGSGGVPCYLALCVLPDAVGSAARAGHGRKRGRHRNLARGDPRQGISIRLQPTPPAPRRVPNQHRERPHAGRLVFRRASAGGLVMVSRRPTKEPRPTIELLLWDPNDFAAETDRLAGMIRARNSLACRGPGVGRANVPEPRRGLGLMLLFEGGSTPPAARSRGGEEPGQAGPLANLLSDGLAAMRRVGGGGLPQRAPAAALRARHVDARARLCGEGSCVRTRILEPGVVLPVLPSGHGSLAAMVPKKVLGTFPKMSGFRPPAFQPVEVVFERCSDLGLQVY